MEKRPITTADYELYSIYETQVYQTQGFDIDVYPRSDLFGGLCGLIRPMMTATTPVSAETSNLLNGCSKIAMDAYNRREGSDYIVNLVVKAGRQIVSGYKYFITFEATNSKGHLQVFQAMVYEPLTREKEVILVRPKSRKPLDNRDYFTELPKPPSNSPELYVKYLKQIKETDGFDIDVNLTNDDDVIKPMFNDTSPISAEIYYMLSDCSRIALDAYNQQKGTDYSVNRVVKSCEQLANAGQIYFITFEGKNSDDLFEVFQAMVYDPCIRAKEVMLVRPKATGAMPSDKRSNMMNDLFTPPRDSHHAADLWETYLKQIKETEGFDIDVYPTNACGVIKPMFNDTSPVSAETYYMLSNCSRISVDAYNQREGTDYTVNRVVKVCTQVDCGTMYFITFEANSKDHFQVFQAITWANKVLLVRPKVMVKDLFMPPRDTYMIKDLSSPPCDASKLWETYLKQIKETEGFDIDVYPTNGCGVIQPMFNDPSLFSAETSYILNHCSSIAVDAYNRQEDTHYASYKVVNACTQTLAAGRMYFITFQAISNDGLKVLQAKLFEPAKAPIEVLLVRLKA